MSELYRLFNEIKSDMPENCEEILTPEATAQIKRRFHAYARAGASGRRPYGRVAAAAVILIAAGLIGLPAGAGVYQKMQDSFTSDDGHLTVDVAIADTETEGAEESLSETQTEAALQPDGVFRVKVHEFTSEEISRWADVLFEGQAVYEAKLQMPGQAPSERVPCDWTFHDWWYYNGDVASGLWGAAGPEESSAGEQDLYAMTEDLHGKEAHLEVRKRTEPGQEREVLYFYYGKYWEAQRYEDFPVTEMKAEDAVRAAEALLDQLGIGDAWTLTRQDTGVWETFPDTVYDLTYKPVFAGKRLLSRSNLHIQVGGGHVLWFEIDSPLDLVETVDTQPETLSRDEAYEALKKYLMEDYQVIGAFYGYDTPEEQQRLIEDMGEDFEMQIYDAQECMCRIKDEEGTGTFLVVPAWHFKADIAGNGDTEFLVDAINGEIIRPEQGY